MIRNRLRRMLAMLTLCAVLFGSLTVSAAAADFQDVPADHWAASEIHDCVELGFFNGQSASWFGLGQSMTRAAFAVVLCRFFGWETAVPTQPIYSDVPLDTWYAGAVETAYAHGALTRQQGSEFRPDDPITREELTVTLVRAMGYSALAGLTQEQTLPFTDVEANAGYIALAYHLGLMNGTSETTFAPDRKATREQVAVILMRLYNKLHGTATEKAAILSDAETIPDLTGFSTVAIPAVRLMYASGSKLVSAMDADACTALYDAARESGAVTLLHAAASSTALKAKAPESAALLAEAVTDGGYDGLFLDIPKLKQNNAAALSALVSALRTELGDRPLYLMAEAPSLQDSIYTGYDYAALSQSADHLVLRIAAVSDTSGALAVAPVDPLEEVYYALNTLRETVPVEKLTLLVNTSGTFWRNSSQVKTLSGIEISALLESGSVHQHYSPRYACAYLTGAEKQTASEVIWYLNGKAAAERIRMLQLLGVNQLFLSDLSTASEDQLSALQ